MPAVFHPEYGTHDYAFLSSTRPIIKSDSPRSRSGKGCRRERRENQVLLRKRLVRVSGYGLDSWKERKAPVESRDSDIPNKRAILASSPYSTFSHCCRNLPVH